MLTCFSHILAGHRYIELFLNSTEDPGVPGGGGPPQGGVGVAGGRFGPGVPQQQQQQSSWSDPRTQVRGLTSLQQY